MKRRNMFLKFLNGLSHPKVVLVFICQPWARWEAVRLRGEPRRTARQPELTATGLGSPCLHLRHREDSLTISKGICRC